MGPSQAHRAVVAQTAHHVCVMYAGKVVERSTTRAVFKRPHHPYTVGLFRSIPKLGHKAKRLDVIPGMVPSALEFPSGCRPVLRRVIGAGPARHQAGYPACDPFAAPLTEHPAVWWWNKNLGNPAVP